MKQETKAPEDPILVNDDTKDDMELSRVPEGASTLPTGFAIIYSVLRHVSCAKGLIDAAEKAR